jgi:hypothetical protein
MVYFRLILLIGMEPNHFYFVVLPLGFLIVILVSLVLYIARKEETLYDRESKRLREMLRSGTIDQKTFERMRNAVKEEIIFAEELERLYTLLQQKKIDKDAYVQLRGLLEKNFHNRVKELVMQI